MRFNLSDKVRTEKGQEVRLNCLEGDHLMGTVIDRPDLKGGGAGYTMMWNREGIANSPDASLNLCLVDPQPLKIGDRVQTRGRQAARIICDDAAGEFSIIALIRNEIGAEREWRGRPDGTQFGFPGIPGSALDDLVLAPLMEVRYFGAAWDEHGNLTVRASQVDRAAAHPPNVHLDCLVRVEFVKGKFDE